MKPALQWNTEGTGGGCMAFVARRDGVKYLITCRDDPGIPAPFEACALGLYAEDADDSETSYILSRDFPNSLAAAQHAEYCNVPTVKDAIDRFQMANRVTLMNPLDCRLELLECGQHTHCGRAMVRILRAAENLLDLMDETDDRDHVAHAVARTCCTIFYG